MPGTQRRTTAVDAYRDTVAALIHGTASQADQLTVAANRIADSLATGGVLHVFGSGHSMLPAIDTTFRAGGLAPVNLVHDPALAPWEPTRVSRVERLAGYGTSLAKTLDVRAGEVVVVLSHSGINAVPVEFALGVRERGAFVVALTSCTHSLATPTRHPEGLRLLDVCDVVLDTGAPEGDVTLTLDDGTETGPTSTLIATVLMHSLAIGAMENLVARGISPPVLRSMNRLDQDDVNDAAVAPYRDRLSRVP